MKKERRRNRSRAEREEILAEYVESGLSQVEFCLERGISVGTMGYWLRKAREFEEGVEEPAASGGFVEVQVTGGGMTPFPVAGMLETARYEVVLRDGKRLVIGTGFKTSEVAALLDVLEAR